MEFYRYEDYRELLQDWLKSQPKAGRGIAQRLAEHLRVSTVLVSQVLNGSRSLQPEYAYGLAQFMGLTPNETEYFLLLVQYENAGTAEYKAHLKKRIESSQTSALQVKNRVTKDIQLSEEAKAKFYSHWLYSAVRLLTDIPDLQTPRALAKALNLDGARVSEILEFLVEQKLCLQESGKYKMAVRSTHLENGSPWIYSRQLQWRQKGLQEMEKAGQNSLFYTGPMVLSEKDKVWVREQLIQIIRTVTERVRNSPSESLMCLNLDWFELYSQDQE